MRALHDQVDAGYHTTLRNMEQNHRRVFHPEINFGNTLQKLKRIQIGSSPQGMLTRRLIKQLKKHEEHCVEVENSLSRD
jgi:hypothetical protein